LNGIFSKSTAYSGLATGVVGIVAVVGPFFTGPLGSTLVIIVSVLTLVWLFLAGYRLNKLGRQLRSAAVRMDAARS